MHPTFSSMFTSLNISDKKLLTQAKSFQYMKLFSITLLFTGKKLNFFNLFNYLFRKKEDMVKTLKKIMSTCPHKQFIIFIKAGT